MVPGACATGGGSPPRASLRRGIPTSAPAARAGSLFRFSRGGRTWHCAPGQGGTAAAKSGPRGGCSGAGPGARRRGRGGARGAEQGERPEARARRRRGRDGAERGGRRAASPGKWGSGDAEPRGGEGAGAELAPQPAYLRLSRARRPALLLCAPRWGMAGQAVASSNLQASEKPLGLRWRVGTCLKFCFSGRHTPALAPSLAVIRGCRGPGARSTFPGDRGFVCSLLPPTGNMEAGAAAAVPSCRFGLFSTIRSAVVNPRNRRNAFLPRRQQRAKNTVF